jgi:Lrp/AsnC family leucine-responsive transcriptional regulator
MDSFKLDPTDIGILNLLQKDAQLTLKELAYKLRRNKSVIGERIKRLTSQGYIKNAVVIIDVKRIKSIFTAFPLIQLKDHYEETFRSFQVIAINLPEVMECHHVMGQYDFLLKIVVSDANAYNEFLRTNISPLPYVLRIESFPMLSEIKRETSYQL